MAKTQTKTTKATTSTTGLSPKQAQVKIVNLLKGIDNDNVVIAKKQEENQRKLNELKAVMPLALTQPSTTPAVKVVVSKSVAPTNGGGTTAAKPIAASAKPKVKATVKATAKPSIKTESPDDRPPLKQVIADILAHSSSPMSKPDIYNAAIAKYGKWSRQSFYNAIKDEHRFQQVGEGFINVKATAAAKTHHADEADEKDEADRFVESVEVNKSTSAVV